MLDITTVRILRSYGELFKDLSKEAERQSDLKNYRPGPKGNGQFLYFHQHSISNVHFSRLGIPIMLFVFPKTNRHFVKSTKLREFQLSASYCDRGLSPEACQAEDRFDEMTSACLSLIVLQIANIPNIIHAKPFPAQRPICGHRRKKPQEIKMSCCR